MGILSPEWDGRIGHWLRKLEADLYEPLGTIDFKTFRTEKHLAYNELRREEFVPAPSGFTWGNPRSLLMGRNLAHTGRIGLQNHIITWWTTPSP